MLLKGHERHHFIQFARAVSIRQPNLRLVPRDSIQSISSDQSTRTAVMACLVAGNSGNTELLRKASAAAREHNGELYAVVVDSHRTRFDKEQVRRLVDDAAFSSDLGAKIVWLDSSDVVGELLQFARQFRIGRIFVTREPANLCSLDYLVARFIPTC